MVLLHYRYNVEVETAQWCHIQTKLPVGVVKQKLQHSYKRDYRHPIVITPNWTEVGQMDWSNIIRYLGREDLVRNYFTEFIPVKKGFQKSFEKGLGIYQSGAR